MIKGIGIDLVNKLRFDKLIKKYGNKIAIKILSTDEYYEFEESKCTISRINTSNLPDQHLRELLIVLFLHTF